MSEQPPPPSPHLATGALTPAVEAALRDQPEQQRIAIQMMQQPQATSSAWPVGHTSNVPTELLLRLMAAVERSPPRPMEVEHAPPSLSLTQIVNAKGGSALLTADVVAIPKTHDAWETLVSPLLQKKTLTKVEFVTCVMGCAAVRGFGPQATPYSVMGSNLAFYKVANDLSAHEYRRVLAAFIDSGMGLEFFEGVSVGGQPPPVAAQAVPMQFAGHPFRQGTSARRLRTPTGQETAAEPAAAQKKARESRGVKKEKGTGNPGG